MSREEVVARVLGVAFAAAVGFVVVIMTACLMSHNRTIVERTPPTVCLPCHPCSIHADWCDPSGTVGLRARKALADLDFQIDGAEQTLERTRATRDVLRDALSAELARIEES